jgi:DNA-binding MarR family transcriptional regulator
MRAGCLCFRARRTARAVTRAYDEQLRPLGIKAPQLTLLSAVAAAGAEGQCVGLLQDVLAMDATTLSRNLRQLEQLGWIAVARAPKDRRVRTYTLTVEGIEKLEAALPVWRQTTATLEKLLAPETPDRVRDILDHLATQAVLGLS